jgi:hypothetical protein
MSTEAARRLGAAVLARRQELEMSQIEIHLNGGPSNTKLTEIENGRLDPLTNQMARKLDLGLDWERGSARRVWNGGDPVPLLQGMPRKSSAVLRRQILEADLEPDKREALLRVLEDTA